MLGQNDEFTETIKLINYYMLLIGFDLQKATQVISNFNNKIVLQLIRGR